MIQSDFTKEYIVDLNKHEDMIVSYFTNIYGKKYKNDIKDALEKTYVFFKGNDIDLIDACKKAATYNEELIKYKLLSPEAMEEIEFWANNRRNAIELFSELENPKAETQKPDSKSEANYFKSLHFHHLRDLEPEKFDYTRSQEVYARTLQKSEKLKKLLDECKEKNQNFLFNVQNFVEEHKDCDIIEDETAAVWFYLLNDKKNLKYFEDIKEIARKIIIATKGDNEPIIDSVFDKHKKTTISEELKKIIKFNLDAYAMFLDSETLHDSMGLFKAFNTRDYNRARFRESILVEYNNNFSLVDRYDKPVNAVTYEVDNLTDNVIIHELDHSIMRKLRKREKETNSLPEQPTQTEKKETELTIQVGLKEFKQQKGEVVGQDITTQYLIEQVRKLDRKKKNSNGENLLSLIQSESDGLDLYSAVNELIVLFNEVMTDYRAVTVSRKMKEDGFVLYNNDKEIFSKYARVFDGCDNMFDLFLSLFTQNVIEGEPRKLIDTVGPINFLKIIRSMQALTTVNLDNCEKNMADRYYKVTLGFYQAGTPDYDMTEDENKYIYHTQIINTALEEAIDKTTEKDDNFMKYLWT